MEKRCRLGWPVWCQGNYLFLLPPVPTPRPKELTALGSGPVQALKFVPAQVGGNARRGAIEADSSPTENPAVDNVPAHFRHPPQSPFQTHSLPLPVPSPTTGPSLRRHSRFPSTFPQSLSQALTSLVFLASFRSQDCRHISMTTSLVHLYCLGAGTGWKWKALLPPPILLWAGFADLV